jgi:hypothetical protein
VRLVAGQILLRPNRKALGFALRWIFDASRWIDVDKTGLLSPCEQTAKGVDKMPRLKRRLTAPIPGGGDGARRDRRKGVRADIADDLFENILALPAGGWGK